jgi:hypothetical protein
MPLPGVGTRPLLISSGTTRFTVSTGTANPMPALEPDGEMIAVVTPIGRFELSGAWSEIVGRGGRSIRIARFRLVCRRAAVLRRLWRTLHYKIETLSFGIGHGGHRRMGSPILPETGCLSRRSIPIRGSTIGAVRGSKRSFQRLVLAFPEVIAARAGR